MEEERIFNNLIKKYNEIAEQGWIDSVNDNTSGVGLTFEKLLGKEPDDFSYPDYDGIEIKTQRLKSNYPVTLFGLAICGQTFPEIERIRQKYGYYDYDLPENKRLNCEFYANHNVLISNRYFFNLRIDREQEKIILLIFNINYELIDDSSYWYFSDFKEKFETKIKYLGFVHAASTVVNDKEKFKYVRLECYKFIDFENFLKLLEKNMIVVSITTSDTKYGSSLGKPKSSCYFRIYKYDLPKLYECLYTSPILERKYL